uniref:Uncharacterized protein n=1 Tax=Noccaea caerulescens TaxID=107243 RepID=A0A1J3G2A1_NOCCA
MGFSVTSSKLGGGILILNTIRCLSPPVTEAILSSTIKNGCNNNSEALPLSSGFLAKHFSRNFLASHGTLFGISGAFPSNRRGFILSRPTPIHGCLPVYISNTMQPSDHKSRVCSTEPPSRIDSGGMYTDITVTMNRDQSLENHPSEVFNVTIRFQETHSHIQKLFELRLAQR